MFSLGVRGQLKGLSFQRLDRSWNSLPAHTASAGNAGPFSYLSLRWQPVPCIQPSSLKGFFRGLLIVCQDTFLFGFSTVPTSHGLTCVGLHFFFFFKNWGNSHSLFFLFLFLKLRIPKPRTVRMLGKHCPAMISQRGDKSSPPSFPFSSWTPEANKADGFWPLGFRAVATACFLDSVLASTGFHGASSSSLRCSDRVIWIVVWRTKSHYCFPLSTFRGIWSHFYFVEVLKWMLGFAGLLPDSFFFLFVICHEC